MSALDSLLDFDQTLYIAGDADTHSQPNPIDEWAKACIFLGMWAKSKYQKDVRRVTFVVLPSREITTAFIAFGSLISSMSNYKDGLTWETFSILDPSVEIFWKRNDAESLYSGNVISVESISSELAIKLEIKESRRKQDVGSVILIPERQFHGWQFSLERPASKRRELAVNVGIAFMEQLIGKISPAWAKSSGHDLLLVTKMSQFKTSIENLLVGVANEGGKYINLESLLGFEQHGDGRHSKMKITHHMRELKTNAGLVILDGPSAFSIKDHVPPFNDLLIVLESSEFNENELGFIGELESAAVADTLVDENLNTLGLLPAGFEVSSYAYER